MLCCWTSKRASHPLHPPVRSISFRPSDKASLANSPQSHSFFLRVGHTHTSLVVATLPSNYIVVQPSTWRFSPQRSFHNTLTRRPHAHIYTRIQNSNIQVYTYFYSDVKKTHTLIILSTNLLVTTLDTSSRKDAAVEFYRSPFQFVWFTHFFNNLLVFIGFSFCSDNDDFDFIEFYEECWYEYYYDDNDE